MKRLPKMPAKIVGSEVAILFTLEETLIKFLLQESSTTIFNEFYNILHQFSINHQGHVKVKLVLVLYSKVGTFLFSCLLTT